MSSRPRIILISDRRIRSFESLWSLLPGVAGAGLTALMIREKDLPGGALLTLTREAVRRCRPLGIEVLVNDRVDVALAGEADGVHLGVASLRVRDATRIAEAARGEASSRSDLARLIVGASTHSLEELRVAEDEGADYAVFGPVFETPSKAAHGPPVGVSALREASECVAIPVLALGGIRLDRIERLEGTNIAGIAAISAILAAEDPVQSVKSIASRLTALLGREGGRLHKDRD